MILMYYRGRASPKHRYNIIEDYGGGGHRTRLRDLKDQLFCLEVPPAPVYKGARGRGGRPGGGAPGRSPTPTGSRTPLPFLVQVGEGEGEKEKGGGILLPEGVGFLLARSLLAGRTPL